ncbi:hypothetical protein QWY16_09890 [Planococcus shenhongbingii]|uniref:hypothetical protein n=1 Tax=Planococcus shenhongbingii TaxID=3058398 RepID=UPI00262B227E|nr:hypothetical protein [Planococcus sp. N016]WKA56827.1 hypothetical protein QWY16_09890 [Planococcus sp. N016]
MDAEILTRKNPLLFNKAAGFFRPHSQRFVAFSNLPKNLNTSMPVWAFIDILKFGKRN